MTELYRKGWIGNTVQGLIIAGAAAALFFFMNFGVEAENNSILAMLAMAFGYTIPLIIVEGLYGLRSGLLCYTMILIPTIFVTPGEAFLLTFHLVLLYIVGFCIGHGFLKTLGKTIISGVISGVILDGVFIFVNHLVAKGAFSEILDSLDFTGMLDVGIQIVVAYLFLYLLYRFLPEWISQLFQVGNFRFHIKNDIYEEYMKHRPKRPLGVRVARILTLEALVLGFFAALVANALIPNLGDVIEVREPGVVTGGAAGLGPNGGELYRPSRKPDAESSATYVSATGSTPTPEPTPRPMPSLEPGEFQERIDWFVNRTQLGAFRNEEDSVNIFVLNSEGIAFDLKLILFLLDIIMPIVSLIHYLFERRTIRPIADMALAMGEFATDSIDHREIAAAKITSRQIHSQDEVEQLHDSLAYTVNEVIDYIQRLQEEQQLKEDLRVAQKASEAKSNFLSNVSHEIRTPINAVLGMDEMILRESKDTRIRKYAMDIKNSGRTLVSLINDLLDFSRIESGKLEILPVEYEMSSTLNDLTNMISVKAEEKNLAFSVDVDERIPHLLIGDEIRIKQCILNILNNAVKYTETGSVKMTVSYEKEDESHIALKIRVTDTGIGIKEEDLKRLFTPFERIEENRNRNIEGAGLGMSIVKQLLDMMGSQLEVSSVYGEGSDFSFRLTQEVISWEPMGNFAEMYARSIESTKEYRAELQAPDAKILVVDDTRMNLTVVRGLLEPTRIRITTAMSGREAVELVKNEHFDMIFLDQRMPGMDGIETLAAMRELPPPGIQGVPVVALTANAISGSRERFIRAGFNDYLTKPIDSKKLESTIASMLPEDKVLLPGDEGYEDGLFEGEAPAASSSGDSVSEPENPLLKDFASIGEIDYAAAIENCMKESILAEAVQDFTMAAKTGPDEIEDFYNQLDAKNFTVKVHALKSSARLIGAMELSKQAAHLESCGDEENWEEIQHLTPKLLADYRLLGEKLLALFDETEDERPEIEAAALAEAYQGIREYVDAFDFDSADSILEMLKEYRVPESEKERYDRICEMVMKLDRDGILEEI